MRKLMQLAGLGAALSLSTLTPVAAEPGGHAGGGAVSHFVPAGRPQAGAQSGAHAGSLAGAHAGEMRSGRSVGFDRGGQRRGFGGAGVYGDGFGYGVGGFDAGGYGVGGSDDTNPADCDLLQSKEGLCNLPN